LVERIVRNLTAMGLIKRSIVDSRPVLTVYQPTGKGQSRGCFGANNAGILTWSKDIAIALKTLDNATSFAFIV